MGSARIFLVLSLLAAAPAALAQGQPGAKALGSADAWHAYEFGEGAARVCYVTAAAASSQSKPSGVQRGDYRIMITHRPAQRQRDEVSFHAGYPVSATKPAVNPGSSSQRTVASFLAARRWACDSSRQRLR